MNKFEDRFNAYIDAHPRQSLQILAIGLCLIWMSAVCVLGVGLYFLLSKICRIQWWIILILGICIAFVIMMIDAGFSLFHINLAAHLSNGFLQNKEFWKLLFLDQQALAFSNLFYYGVAYVVGFPVLFAGILSMIDLIKDSPHQRKIDALQKGEHLVAKKELSDKKIDSALKKLDDSSADATILGVSNYSGKPIIIPDYFVNQILLVLGTTGGGKTVTLRRFYKRAIAKGYPLIIVDGKPTDDNVAWVRQLAEKNNRLFYGFNCGEYSHYDPLANGGYTELKDKIICLKDQWENEYYRSIAEAYLQTTFEVLTLSGARIDLKQVVKYLNFDELQVLARNIGNSELLERVGTLANYERKDITGLQAHLHLLIHSELGGYFSVDDNTFSIPKVIEENAVVYFALPALRFPSFSKVLGKLVINDLKAAIDRNNNDSKSVFMVFDEFSVFAGEQVLNLVNMGRGKGVHAIFGTQGLADLDKVDPTFKNQVMNCVNTLICHRLNDQESAETVSAWIGTKDAFTISTQFNPNKSDAGVGTIADTKEFIVHPDDIKQGLRTGEAYCVSKVGRFGLDKVIVMYM